MRCGAPGRVWSGRGWFGQGGHERFERGGPALPVGTARFGGDGLDELLPERFPVTAEGVLNDRGRQSEHGALPGRVEGRVARPVCLPEEQTPFARMGTGTRGRRSLAAGSVGLWCCRRRRWIVARKGDGCHGY